MDLSVFVPSGMFGAKKDEPIKISFLRQIAEHFENDFEWGEKYGIDYENDIFFMKPFCWCDKDICPWCNVEISSYENGNPNFIYKPTGLKVWWYKYIGREMEYSQKVSEQECINILKHCKDGI